MGAGDDPSSEAPESLPECSALGKVSNPPQGRGREIRLYQRITYIVAGSPLRGGDDLHRRTGMLLSRWTFPSSPELITLHRALSIQA